MKRIAYYKPSTLEEAWDLSDRFPEAHFIAGGTDLLVKIRNGKLRPAALISLRSIPELHGIDDNGSMRIGAMSTISEVKENSIISEKYPILTEAASSLGSVQIRNAATIGGNLCNCSPCADTALPLLVLEARVRLKTPDETREVRLDEFFLGPGKSCLDSREILTDIIIDPPAANARGIFMKKGRVKMDLAIASVAVMAEAKKGELRDLRIAAGSVASVPLRLYKAEEFLEKNSLTKENISQSQELAVQGISPITDIRAGAEYRRRIVRVYIKRAIDRLSEGTKK